MTGTLCQSAALDSILALWIAKIADLFAIIVKAILTMAENVGNTLHEPGVFYREAERPELSRPILKLETMGGHARLPSLIGAGSQITDERRRCFRYFPVDAPMLGERS